MQIVELKPPPKPDPADPSLSLRDAAAGLKDLSSSIREFPEHVSREVRAVEHAFVAGLGVGVAVSLCLLLVWRAVRR